jgi:uncharacterized protein (DUF427 family)
VGGARIERHDGRLVVRHGGEVLVDTDEAWVVDEPGCPLRYYVPRSAVVAPLVPSRTATRCGWKGDASYWSIQGGAEDVAWSYEAPLPGFALLAGHVAFDRARVDECP